MPPKPKRGQHRHRHPISGLSGATSSEALAEALRLVIPDSDDAAYVARCILSEGPVHHRAASWALIMVASKVAEELGVAGPPGPTGPSVPVDLRLPPHEQADEDSVYPVAVPLAPLELVLRGERDVEGVADALVDGPPHHALANAALMAILGRLLQHSAAGRS